MGLIRNAAESLSKLPSYMHAVLQAHRLLNLGATVSAHVHADTCRQVQLPAQ